MDKQNVKTSKHEEKKRPAQIVTRTRGGERGQTVKHGSHQGRILHGSSRISPDHPGPRNAWSGVIRGENASTVDRRSKKTSSPPDHPGPNTAALRMNTVSTRSQHGWPRIQHGGNTDHPGRTPDQHGGATDGPGHNTDPTRWLHGPSRTTPDWATFPDHPGWPRTSTVELRMVPDPTRTFTDLPGANTVQHGPYTDYPGFINLPGPPRMTPAVLNSLKHPGHCPGPCWIMPDHAGSSRALVWPMLKRG